MSVRLAAYVFDIACVFGSGPPGRSWRFNMGRFMLSCGPMMRCAMRSAPRSGTHALRRVHLRRRHSCPAGWVLKAGSQPQEHRRRNR